MITMNEEFEYRALLILQALVASGRNNTVKDYVDDAIKLAVEFERQMKAMRGEEVIE